MLKKLSLLAVAFAVGAMVSLSIQACADDYNEIPEQNKTESSSNSSGTSNDFSAWKSNGIESSVSYDENGQISQKINYTYNSNGWVTKMTAIGYTNVSGVRYKSLEYIYTYTYSSSGDIQYSNSVITQYNENGQVIYTSRTSGEVRLRK